MSDQHSTPHETPAKAVANPAANLAVEPDEVRLDIPLDAPPWLVNREPKFVHPTMSFDEVLRALSEEIDHELLDELLALTPAERLRRHEGYAQDLCRLRGVLSRQE